MIDEGGVLFVVLWRLGMLRDMGPSFVESQSLRHVVPCMYRVGRLCGHGPTANTYVIELIKNEAYDISDISYLLHTGN